MPAPNGITGRATLGAVVVLTLVPTLLESQNPASEQGAPASTCTAIKPSTRARSCR